MKYDLPCAIVQDLLPNYLEGLTSEETNRAIEAHLAACPDCAAHKSAMAGEAPAAETAEQAREVDYLKKVKRRSGRRTLIAVLITVLLFVAGAAAKLFIIGQPVTETGFGWAIMEYGDTLELTVVSNGSANAFKDFDVEIRDGVAYVTGRSVLVSSLYREGRATVEIPLEGVSQIFVCGRLVWADGVAVHPETLQLYESKTLYVGDISALNQIANQLEIRPHVGDWLNSLHTSSEPYRWTLEFTTDGWQGVYKKAYIREDMPRYAAQMLALVENLSEVGWTWTDEDGEFHEEFITLEEVNALLPEWVETYNATYGTQWRALSSVKEYADSPAALQKLILFSDPITTAR
jgi:hypothetical protein